MNYTDKKNKKTAILDLEHQLDVQKTELEMQNEELLTIQSILQENIKEYTTLFNHAPVCYFVLDANGIIKNINNSGVDALGVAKEELIGKPLSLFLSNQLYQDDFYRHRISVMDANEKKRVECEFKKRDGTVFFALMESCLVKDIYDRFKYFLTTIIDISDRREVQHNLEVAK